MPAAMIKAQIGNDLWDRYFKFCVVRNPYEKAISAFYFFTHHSPVSPTGHVWSTGRDVDNFERWLIEIGPPVDRDRYVIESQFCLDDVIRYENLDADIARICDRIDTGWEPGRLPKYKSGFRNNEITARQLYTEASLKIVESAYDFEFDYFRYSFPSA